METAEDLEVAAYQAALAMGQRLKTAGDAVPEYALAGRLYLSSSGWLLLSVPNAVVRGLFDALQVPGIELPPSSRGLNAHISVMRKEEVEQVGADKITEKGHFFSYQLGPIKTVNPKGWSEMSKVWFVEVQSPELKALRKSYGLTALPNGDHEFHVSIAVRRKGVLQQNDVSKAAAHDTAARLIKAIGEVPDDAAADVWYRPATNQVAISVGDWAGCSKEIAHRAGRIVGEDKVERDSEWNPSGGGWDKLDIPEAPGEECCPDCMARLERGDDGNCNRCGKPWPQKEAAVPNWLASCAAAG